MTNIIPLSRAMPEPVAQDACGFAAIGLYSPKNAANLGGVMRAADCFGASLLVVSNQRIKKHGTDTTKAWRRMPVIETDDLLSVRPYASQMVVVELVPGAVELHEFEHPERAFYVFGPEEGNVPRQIIEKAQHVVRLRAHHCLNLAATVNVVLHDRASKRGLG